jgi:hypothetical protein
MLSVKLITHKRINKLDLIRLTCFLSFFLIINVSKAQDNSPYSRYGLGDLHPNSNILNRGMGGISAAFSDPFSINFSNPASYSRFYSLQELRSKKSAYGRILLDIGLDFDNRTLREFNNPEKFTSPNAYFSYLQMGIPLKKNWGMVFGLRPVSKISYQVYKREKLYDPITNQPIDSAYTEFNGDGGSYLANFGTGFAIKNFSVGVNGGYFFGRKDYSTRRIFINDSVAYNNSNQETKSTFGDLFFNMGMQYRIDLNKNKTKYFQIGSYGNIKHNLNSRRDYIRETFYTDIDGNNFRQDSVTEQLDVKGIVNFPASFGGGILFEQLPEPQKTGWLFGIDYIHTGWNDYRFNGQIDSVKTNWQIKIGGQIRPALKDAKYKTLMSYRGGVFFGNDYIYLKRKLPTIGITAGVSLPIANLKDASRRFRSQYSVVNVSAEYIKRGNKENALRENLFRVSVGFTLSDLWFVKKKYE